MTANKAHPQLSRQQLVDTILLQQRELRQRFTEPYIPRMVHAPAWGQDNLIRVILGPRRAGKSFFAIHWMRQSGDFAYLNLDDEALAGLTDFSAVLPALEEVYPGVRALLIDEIQNFPNWELLVNRLQRQGYRLTLTGSNAHLLSRELSTHLTGRHLPIIIFPFSFAEQLQASAAPLTAAEKQASCARYAQSGGYPEPLLRQLDAHSYLTTLLRAILYKDILQRLSLRHPHGLDALATYLFSCLAGEYSLRRLTEVAQSRSVHTVQKYLHALEEAFLLFSVPRFSWKVREQAKSNKKIYTIDNGMAGAAGFRGSANLGRLYENLVATALHRRALEGAHRLYFWKNAQQEEVDFVVHQGTRVAQLIQVCATVEDPRTQQREIRALLKAGKELRCDRLLILTENRSGQEEAAWMDLHATVEYQPLWKWLSGPGLPAPPSAATSTPNRPADQ